jgi:hypothetical protein
MNLALYPGGGTSGAYGPHPGQVLLEGFLGNAAGMGYAPQA